MGAVVFAVTRIISALFLKDTLEASKREADSLVAELKRERASLMRKLGEFFREADQSGDGFLDRDEFEAMLRNPKVRMWFSGLDLQVHEYVGLFNLIDTGSGVVSFQEFMTGVQRLKGTARSLDLIGIVLDVQKIMQLLVVVRKELRELSGGQSVASRQVTGEVMNSLLENSRSSNWLRDS